MKHEKPKANVDGWLKTDEKQFVKKLDDSKFMIYDEIAYGDDNEYTDVFYGEVDIADYSDEELNKLVRGYYKDINEVKEIYSHEDEWKQVVAEIIAEQDDHNYTTEDFE